MGCEEVIKVRPNGIRFGEYVFPLRVATRRHVNGARETTLLPPEVRVEQLRTWGNQGLVTRASRAVYLRAVPSS